MNTQEHHDAIRAALDTFCRAQNATPAAPGQTISLAGRGSVPVVAVDLTAHGWWAFLRGVAEPSGLDETDLEWLWSAEYGDPVVWPRNATLHVPSLVEPGLTHALHLIHSDSLRHLLLNHSPE